MNRRKRVCWPRNVVPYFPPKVGYVSSSCQRYVVNNDIWERAPDLFAGELVIILGSFDDVGDAETVSAAGEIGMSLSDDTIFCSGVISSQLTLF